MNKRQTVKANLYYQKAMIQAVGSKVKKLSPELTIELYYLFLGYYFTKLYHDEATVKSEIVEKLLADLEKKCLMFSSNFGKIMDICTKLFADVEANEFKKTNKGLKNKMEKRLSFCENGDIEVHGLLFAVSIILQHKRLGGTRHKNNSLFLPYSACSKIYYDFDSQKSNLYKNSRVLPVKFTMFLFPEGL